MKSRFLAVTIAVAVMMMGATAFAGPGKTPGKGTCVVDLSIEKDGPELVKVGDKYWYEIEVCNKSLCDLTDIKLVDVIPDRVKFEKAIPEESDFIEQEGEEFGGLVVWKDIALRAGQCDDFKVKVHALGPPDRRVKNKACVKHDGLVGKVCDKVFTDIEQGNEP